jgi:hypothetical protein
MLAKYFATFAFWSRDNLGEETLAQNEAFDEYGIT